MLLNQQIERWLSASRESFNNSERPFVTLSYAQGWDGSITLRTGQPLALSGEESTRLTHHLRSQHDGILVGIGTVLSDDPQLNVRQWSGPTPPGPNPQPIVLDSQLRIPAGARLCHLADKRCWVMTSSSGEGLVDSSLEIITLPGDELRRRGIRSLMVEGGANVITAFLKERLVDALVLTMAPTLVGGYKAVGDLDIVLKAELPRIAPAFSGRLGDDVIMWGNLHYGAASS